MDTGGRNREQEQRGGSGKGAFWLPEPCSETPRGSCDDISFRLFFTGMRNAGSVSEIIANSKLVRFHGPQKGAGGEIGRRGVFLAVRASWLID